MTTHTATELPQPTAAAEPAEQLARRFLDAVAGMEQELKNRHPEASNAKGLGEVIRTIEGSNKVVRFYKRDLRRFAELRNAIVHNPYDDGRPIAAPLASTVARVEQIAEQIKTPTTVATALKGCPPLQPVSRDDRLHELMPGMLANDYSQLVVFDEGTPATLLTTNTIARWVSSLLEPGGEAIVPVATVGEILTFAEDEPTRVVKETTPVANVLAAFSADIVPRAVLVTPSGKRQSRPTGIFVTADIPRLHGLLGV